MVIKGVILGLRLILRAQYLEVKEPRHISEDKQYG